MAKLQGFLEVAERQRKLHEQAMTSTQKMNKQGFKRLHRYYARKFFCEELCIQTFSLDYLGETIETPVIAPIHAPSDLKAHMTLFISEMEADQKRLVVLNNEFRAEHGKDFKHGEDMICCLSRLICKFKRRWFDRLEKTGWGGHDEFILDHFIHEKYKQKEKEDYEYED